MTKTINPDVAAFKDDFFKGLSLRECVFGGIALLAGVGGILLLHFYCIGNKNKPPAMQVCSQTALASSKKPPCYNEYKVRQPNHYNKEESKWTIIVYHTQNGHANII